jgi:hypothetical protein
MSLTSSAQIEILPWQIEHFHHHEQRQHLRELGIEVDPAAIDELVDQLVRDPANDRLVAAQLCRPHEAERQRTLERVLRRVGAGDRLRRQRLAGAPRPPFRGRTTPRAVTKGEQLWMLLDIDDVLPAREQVLTPPGILVNRAVGAQ